MTYRFTPLRALCLFIKSSLLWLMACIASISITPQDGAAQSRSHSNWIFGTGCSLSWNADNQISTGINPVINTYEGVATFSDPVTGQLLLYTDGRTAWNRQNQIISANNLGGDPSAAQSGIIIPSPGRLDEFYIFTQPRNTGSMRYSQFDMSGLGLQIGGTLIAPESGSTSETIGATPHRNGRDFWIVTADGSANTVLVYLLTPDGLSGPDIYPQQAVSPVPTSLGQVVFSSDSRKSCIESTF